MNRIIKEFPFLSSDLENLKRRMLLWANQSNILLFLDSNQYTHTEGRYECICAKGAVAQIIDDDNSLSQLKHQFESQQDWLFGSFNYDFKNKLEQLSSEHKAHFSFPDIHLFRPEIVCYIRRKEMTLVIESLSLPPDSVYAQILSATESEMLGSIEKINFEKRLKREEYLKIIQILKQHIVEGDCYEINFCNENYAETVNIHPTQIFNQLNSHSKAPFAAYYKVQDQYLMCASPERFMHKKGNKIIAQPIKGTSSRMADMVADEQQKLALLESIKERAENVMIVDLMRNDLARFCELDSIQVDELFGIYSFPNVHQMISTVSGQLRGDLSLIDALRLSFPMGSMTGAPKIMVMQLIERYEKARRELFSGTVGYISPEGDFDFNVVIRSLMYNSASQYLSFQTGGAITFDSNPEQEWEETRLKAAAIERIFQ